MPKRKISRQPMAKFRSFRILRLTRGSARPGDPDPPEESGDHEAESPAYPGGAEPVVLLTLSRMIWGSRSRRRGFRKPRLSKGGTLASLM